jgi:hypothetical protein
MWPSSSAKRQSLIGRETLLDWGRRNQIWSAGLVLDELENLGVRIAWLQFGRRRQCRGDAGIELDVGVA